MGMWFENGITTLHHWLLVMCLQTEIDQWLVKRPDVNPLKTCRMSSRKLRIEFGHKMVEQKEIINVWKYVCLMFIFLIY